MCNNTEIYCGVEGSICNKNHKYFDYALCCIECTEECKNCILTSKECDLKRTKTQLKQILLHNLNEEKERLEEELQAINTRINSIIY